MTLQTNIKSPATDQVSSHSLLYITLRTYSNSRADALADTGREQDTTVSIDDKEWIEGHLALQDGVRLQALNAKHTYIVLLKWYTKKKPPILHQEVLDEAKDKIQDATGLRPTNRKLLKSIQALKIPPRIKDHMRCMLTSKIRCGAFWSKVLGHTERAHCSFCKKKRNIKVIETEQHMWLECTNSGQAQAWETTKKIWRKLSERDWPPITLGLIQGSVALTFEKCKTSRTRSRGTVGKFSGRSGWCSHLPPSSTGITSQTKWERA